MRLGNAWKELAVFAAAFVTGMALGQRARVRSLEARIQVLEAKWAHPCVLALPGDLSRGGGEKRQ